MTNQTSTLQAGAHFDSELQTGQLTLTDKLGKPAE